MNSKVKGYSVVIGRYAKVKTCAVVVIYYFFVVLLVFETLHRKGSGTELADHLIFNAWTTMLIVGWVGGLMTGFFATAIVVRLIFYDSIAIWTEGDVLVYGNKYAFTVERSVIQSVAAYSGGRYNGRGIAVSTYNGDKKLIDVRLLSESREVVLERIKDWVAAVAEPTRKTGVWS